MKQVRLKFPLNKADAFAEFSFTNSIRVILSWSVDDFFDAKLVVICHFEAEKEEIVKNSEWFKFVGK
jgi:hypothetical protein